MEMTDHIEEVNRKMFQKIRQTSDYLAVFFCKSLNLGKLFYSNSLMRKFKLQIVMIANSVPEYWQRLSTLMTRPMVRALIL